MALLVRALRAARLLYVVGRSPTSPVKAAISEVRQAVQGALQGRIFDALVELLFPPANRSVLDLLADRQRPRRQAEDDIRQGLGMLIAGRLPQGDLEGVAAWAPIASVPQGDLMGVAFLLLLMRDQVQGRTHPLAGHIVL